MSSGSDALKKIQEIEQSLMARIPEHKLRPRLEPTRRAVELLGDPQKSYRVVHITGTNGKTSTSRIIERILREHGLRTGRFTSPHLINLNERIALDGEPIDNEILYEVFKDIEPVLDMVDQELLDQGESRLTFFEALAVLAFAAFADAPIDVLVLEVGMGGAWDSTNVADGDVAVFTPIDLDHQERLGETITEIAETKSGIIKSGAAVVSAVQTQEALEVLERVSSEIGDTFRILGQDFTVTEYIESEAGITFSVEGLAGKYENLFIPLHGAYQAANAAVAIAAVEEFIGGATALFQI
jgi:dihydrofolate synthase/folylpolyglutamate synthase